MESNNTLKVSDKLAYERTYLANERTLLAYLRTYIGMVSAGVAINKIFHMFWTTAFSIVLLSASPFCLLIGIIRYLNTKERILKYLNE